MSIILKCDRCGRTFETFQTLDGEPRHLPTQIKRISESNNFHRDPLPANVELCSACSKELNEWLRSGVKQDLPVEDLSRVEAAEEWHQHKISNIKDCLAYQKKRAGTLDRYYCTELSAWMWICGIGSFILAVCLAIIHPMNDQVASWTEMTIISLLACACLVVALWQEYLLAEGRKSHYMIDNFERELASMEVE